MSDQPTPDLEARLDAWLANRAPTEIPASFADRIASIPRSGAPARRPRLTLVPVTGRRSPMGLLAAAVMATTLAILGGGLFLAASQRDEGLTISPEPARLLYGLDGDIYLADQDGGNPTTVAAGASLFEGSPWAPDGRHFLSYDHARRTADISDPDGHVVASFANLPSFNGFPVWSPDSSRLQAWTDGFRQISIYGLDGVLQGELPLPEGYARVHENLGVWAPDGRSVRVLIARDQIFPCTQVSPGMFTEPDAPACAAHEAWELPIDGSAPRQLGEAVTSTFGVWGPSFTRDGTRVAFSGRPGEERRLLYVANPDGTDPRLVVRAGQDPDRGEGFLPIWSPSGEHLAYLVWAPGDESRVDLKVVDIATGTARTLVPGWQYAAWPPYSWSPDGDTILFSRQDGPATGLWAIGTDGSDATLLVEGATQGEWQPAPLAPAPAPTP